MGDDGNGMVDVAVEPAKDGGDEVIINEALDPRLHGFLALGLDRAIRLGVETPALVRTEVLLPQLGQLHHAGGLARGIEARLYLGDRLRRPDGTL